MITTLMEEYNYALKAVLEYYDIDEQELFTNSKKQMFVDRRACLIKIIHDYTSIGMYESLPYLKITRQNYCKLLARINNHMEIYQEARLRISAICHLFYKNIEMKSGQLDTPMSAPKLQLLCD